MIWENRGSRVRPYFQGGQKLRPPLRKQGKLLLYKLEPAPLRRQPQAEVPEAQGGQGRLPCFDALQILRGDGPPGGDPGGQAGVGGLVPGEQPRLPGQDPDALLGQPALPQRGADLQLPQGPHAGAVPGVVRGVGAVQQQGKAIESRPLL